MFSVGTAPILQPLLGFLMDHFSGCNKACHTVADLTVHAYQWSLALVILGLGIAACIGLLLPKKKVMA